MYKTPDRIDDHDRRQAAATAAAVATVGQAK